MKKDRLGLKKRHRNFMYAGFIYGLVGMLFALYEHYGLNKHKKTVTESQSYVHCVQVLIVETRDSGEIGIEKARAICDKIVKK